MQNQSTMSTKLTLFLSRLPETATNEKVKKILQRFGQVDKVKLKMIKNGKTCSGYGFIELTDHRVAHKIVSESNLLKVLGKTVKV